MAGMTHPTRSLSAQSPPGAPEREAALEQPKELNLCQALDWARHHLVKRWSCQLEIRDLAAAPDQWALSVSAHLAMPGRSLKEQDGLSDAHPEGGSPRRRAAQCGHRSLMESRSEGRRAAAAKVAGKPESEQGPAAPQLVWEMEPTWERQRAQLTRSTATWPCYLRGFLVLETEV